MDQLQREIQGKPDLVFNLMESFGDGLFGAVGVVGFLDLLGLPYTGGGPGEFYVQEDKALTKKILAGFGVPSPRRRARKRSAPGIGCSSRTSTPSISISHDLIAIAPSYPRASRNVSR